jgi:hypothetical protein
MRLLTLAGEKRTNLQTEKMHTSTGTFRCPARLDVARLGRRTAVVERQRIGGACPNIACMPTNNEIRGAEGWHV